MVDRLRAVSLATVLQYDVALLGECLPTFRR